MDLFDTFFGELLMTFPHCHGACAELRGCNSGRYSRRPAATPRQVAAILGNLVPIPFSFFCSAVFLTGAQIQLGWTENRLAGAPGTPQGPNREKVSHHRPDHPRGNPAAGDRAWTGALVADVLDLRLRTALPAIALGVLIAGIITTTVTCGVIRVFW